MDALVCRHQKSPWIMFINHKTKTIVAEHWERPQVCNFLTNVVRGESGWSVRFVMPETAQIKPIEGLKK